MEFAMGKSYNEVEAGFLPGGAYEGMRFATSEEAWQVIEHGYGYDPSASGQANADAVNTLLRDMGSWFTSGGYSITDSAMAFVDDASLFGIYYSFDQDPNNPNPFSGRITSGNNFFPAGDFSLHFVGHFLVDEDFVPPIPEPAGIAVLAAAFLGVIAFIRRRKAPSHCRKAVREPSA